MGGTQDNGFPFLIWSEDDISFGDVSGGDGSFSAFAQDYMYTSSRGGYVLRLGYTQDPSLPGILFPNGGDIALGHPPNAEDQLFINPFAIDPVGENIMYYPAGRVLWCNTSITGPPTGDYTVAGWEELTSLAMPAGTFISALTATHMPAHVLYYGASSKTGHPSRRT